MGAINIGNDKYLHFDELPDNLIEQILTWLPAEYLCRFLNVNEQWKTIFSSSRFITRQWAEAPPNKNPWVLVGAVDSSRDCWVYSSFTRDWKRSCFSLPIWREKKVHLLIPVRFLLRLLTWDQMQGSSWFKATLPAPSMFTILSQLRFSYFH